MEKRDTNTKELIKFDNAKMLFSAICIPIKKAIEKEVSYASLKRCQKWNKGTSDTI
jgi:hypothetical protein